MTIPKDGDPHARRLRGGRMSEPYRCYFVTKCTEGRRPILAVPSAAERIIESLSHLRQTQRIRLLAFVVMPDHYHAVLCLLPGEELSDLMRSLGSYTGRRIRRDLGLLHRTWQDDGFYDHACRNDREVYDSVEYVHSNPVRRGLVGLAEEWPFSSAYPGQRAMLDWDWWR